jgi:endo-1,3(4)-beta-glucanase
MTAYLVPGSPYMTFDYEASTPLLTSQNGIESFNGKTLNQGDTGKAGILIAPARADRLQLRRRERHLL